MLSAFAQLQASAEAGKYTVAFATERIPIYSERSGKRDLAQLRAALATAQPGHRLLIIAPYADALRELCATDERFIWLAPVSFAEPPPDTRLIASDAALENFINDIGADDKFTIFVLPQWRQAGDYVLAVMRQLLERAAARLKTIGHFEKLWQINFRVNAPAAAAYADIAALGGDRPVALVMAGPSLDSAQLPSGTIWCADTALPVLLQRKIYPRVVFSVDAGFASREHFVGALTAIREKSIILAGDLLGYPAVQRLPFAERLTYASSHPLLQNHIVSGRSDLTPVENPAGDVGSLMRAVYRKLFGEAPVQIFGHDGAHRRRVTHARGTAYFLRQYAVQNRLTNTETYMLKLSRRYA
ncbi:MAG: hypothetical protein J0L53_02640 [Spirochaetes bacterium]|nr:hypothetical protein [Spirochaetota bacterium]